MLPVLPLLVLARLLLGGGANAPQFASTLRGVVWALAALGWAAFLIGTIGVLATPQAGPALKIGYVLTALLWTGALIFPFEVLRRLARRGAPKPVYYLGHLVLVSGRTGEVYSGATLLAALALAHRGDVRAEEIAWLRARHAKETQPFGVFATCEAVILMLSSRVAEAGELPAEARELRERARALLGTVSFMSSGALPRAVRALVHELLAYQSAELGDWGTVAAKVPGQAPAQRALGAWIRFVANGEAPTWRERRARRQLASPDIEALWARRVPEIGAREEARAVAAGTHAALLRGEAVSDRAILFMLRAFDRLLDPASPDCLLSETERADPVFSAGLCDDLAGGLVAAIGARPVPIHALAPLGPISGRVYAELESRVSQALTQQLARLEAGLDELDAARWGLGAPLAEWTMASSVCHVFRRFEATLGEAAAAARFNRYLVVLSRQAVRLTNVPPRMRPLAHALFHTLCRDAARFGDPNAALMRTNMNVSRGVR